MVQAIDLGNATAANDLGYMYDVGEGVEPDVEKAIMYFDKGFDHYKEYERISEEGDYSYSAPLVSYLSPIKKGDLRTIGENFWQKEVKHFPEDFKNELRKNEKYAVCFE